MLLLFERVQLLLLEHDGLMKDGHGNLTGVVEKRVVDEQGPEVTIQQQMPTQGQDVVPAGLLPGDSIGNVLNWVDDFQVEVELLKD
jgi:hypothetical protein